jgi:hypothetical protein
MTDMATRVIRHRQVPRWFRRTMLALGLLLATTWAILDVHKGRLGGAAFALACGAYLIFSYFRVRRHGARRLDVPAELRQHEVS